MKLFVNEVNENSVFGFRQDAICICSSEETTNLFLMTAFKLLKAYKIIKLCWAWLIKQSV